MSKTVTLGKRLIPLEHIALVEPFDPTAYARMQTERDFKARVVLIGRESMLTEDTPAAFAEIHGFRVLAGEEVGINPAIRFAVENFEPAEGFNPKKPYLSRLVWRDLDGNTQSKLLLSAPEAVLSVVIEGVAPPTLTAASSAIGEQASKPSGKRRRTRLNATSLRPIDGGLARPSP